MLYANWVIFGNEQQIKPAMMPKMKSYGKEKNCILRYLLTCHNITHEDVVVKETGLDNDLVRYLVDSLSRFELLNFKQNNDRKYQVVLTSKGVVFAKYQSFPETMLDIFIAWIRTHIATILGLLISVSALIVSIIAINSKPPTSYPSEPTQNIPSKSSYPDSLANDQCSP